MKAIHVVGVDLGGPGSACRLLDAHGKPLRYVKAKAPP